MRKYPFCTTVLGSDIDAALMRATEEARWARPGDSTMTPDRMAIATKAEHVVVQVPPRVRAQSLADWVRGTADAPARYEQLVLDLRVKAEDPKGPALILPMAYTEESEYLGQLELNIGHGYHRPFAALVIGTAPLPSNGAGGVKAKKVARRAKATITKTTSKPVKKATARRSRRTTKAA